MLVYDLSYGLTFEQAASSKKLFQIKKTHGPGNLIKLLAVIVKSFCDSIKATKTMDAVDIFECSELLSETYTHDSVKDIILALKNAKKDGKTFYNAVSTPVIFEILTKYFDQKSAYFEAREKDAKSKNDGSVRSEAYTQSVVQEKRIERQEKMYSNKELKQVQDERREIKKLHGIIDQALNSKLTDGTTD